MTKTQLITTIRDSLVSGNQKDAEDAIDKHDENICLKYTNWKYDNEREWYKGKNQDWVGLDHKQRFEKFLNDNK